MEDGRRRRWAETGNQVAISDLFISWRDYKDPDSTLEYYVNVLIDRRSGEVKRTIESYKGTSPIKDAAGKCVKLEPAKRVI